MLNREFTLRERLLMILCVVLALGIFYYQFVHKGIQQQIKEASTESIELEMAAEQEKAAEIEEMEQVIAKNEGKVIGDIAVYNNLAAEISFVGGIMNKRATNVSLSWGNPVLNGVTVRRGVKVDFETTKYQYLKQILKAFNESPYRCIVYDLSVADNSPNTRSVTVRNPDGTTTTATVRQKTGIKDGSKMKVSFNATFFETIEGAASTEGLVIEKTEEDEEPGVLETRAHAYE